MDRREMGPVNKIGGKYMRKKSIATAVLTTALLLAGCAGNEEIPTADVGKVIAETPSNITMGESGSDNSEAYLSSAVLRSEGKPYPANQSQTYQP